ncbi:hypothetical protein GCM10020000_00200 [Streptomyces olivoverticillatus]
MQNCCFVNLIDGFVWCYGGRRIAAARIAGAVSRRTKVTSDVVWRGSLLMALTELW